MINLNIFIKAILIFLSINYTFADNTNNISKDLLSWNSKQKIKLLSHQLSPINYLENNPKQHGLLIYHQVGTGKTYLSIGFAERNQNNKVILIVPKFLQAHWRSHLESYGVKNINRYQIITHEQVELLLNIDLSDKIVILDEVHKIIDNINTSDNNVAYTKLYLHLNNAKRLLVLSATPVYKGVNDLASIVNLVAGYEVLPFNELEFRNKFTSTRHTNSFFSGHLLRSRFFDGSALLAGLFFALNTKGAASLVAISSGILLPFVLRNMVYTIDSPDHFRDINIKALFSQIAKYISYYEIDDKNKKEYPTHSVNIELVRYQKPQIDFLMKYSNSNLTVKELKYLLRDDTVKYTDDFLSVNSTSMQNKMKQNIKYGMMISNLLDVQANKKNYPEKFTLVLSKINKSKGPVIVYSHFYYNGLLLFKQYLDDMGYQGKYKILHVNDDPIKFKQTMDAYNDGKIQILLLHPEITEGASFKGTQQMHILEPTFNKAFQDQVIGRVLRYRSHAHLPPNMRNVEVLIWKSTFGFFDLNHQVSLREDWQKNFFELNYYAERTQIDINNQYKHISPDDLADLSKKELEDSTSKLTSVMSKISVEQNLTDIEKVTGYNDGLNPFLMADLHIGRFFAPKISGVENNNIKLNNNFYISLNKPVYGKYIAFGFESGFISMDMRLPHVNYDYDSKTTSFDKNKTDKVSIFLIDMLFKVSCMLPIDLGNIGYISPRVTVGAGLNVILGVSNEMIKRMKGELPSYRDAYYDNDIKDLFRLGRVVTIEYAIDYYVNSWFGVSAGLQQRYIQEGIKLENMFFVGLKTTFF